MSDRYLGSFDPGSKNDFGTAQQHILVEDEEKVYISLIMPKQFTASRQQSTADQEWPGINLANLFFG